MAYADTNILGGFKSNFALAMSFMPRKSKPATIAPGALFETDIDHMAHNVDAIDAIDAIKAAPLPPCKPLSKSERSEADMMARIRGALYSDDA